MKIERSLYLEATKPGVSELLSSVGYLGTDLVREEVFKSTQSSDNYQGWRRRTSSDNGRTWSGFTPIEGVNRQLPEGGVVDFSCASKVNPVTGQVFRVMMKRIWPGGELYTFNWETHEHPFHDHVLIREDDGALRCLRYEEGPEYSSAREFDPDFARTNRAYMGCDMCFDDVGRVFYPLACQPDNASRGGSRAGVVLMRRELSGEWLASDIQYISRDVSSRGLLEPDAAVLKDGRILIICRGSNTATTPGRKWMTVSTDGGKTLQPIEELRYSDGERFYSPSSFHRLVRSTRTGALYWFGNIVSEAPEGNLPRRPLMMARFDEEKLGLVRDSVVVIDDHETGDHDFICFSNFQILENHETLDLELYMTRGLSMFDHEWKSSVYRYLIQPT